MSLLLVSLALSALGALSSPLARRSHTVSKGLACLFGIAASAAAIAAGFAGLTGAVGLVSYATPLAFANFSFMLNGLSGLMLVLINVLALAAWVYGLAYFDEYSAKDMARIGFFMNVFVAAMCMVVTVDNAFWFLVFFELMSLSSYFLVIIDGTEEAKRGGLMYLIVAHVGFLLIAVSFLLLASQAGSLEFQSFREAGFAPALASAAFVLAFLGFGCKAGIVPLHSWLPQAHPAAPSNVSALMSGGMIKIGIFGMIKVCLDLIGPSSCELWWGAMVLVVGCITAVIGVAYALNENDLKRLLAYSSVENIGVILLGLGICVIGAAASSDVLTLMGLVAALFHSINHAAFKGLLFLGAGSVLYSTGTRDMQLLGGLHRVLPLASALFLVGSLAIAALPPLNGFASEWLAYQAMISAATSGGFALRALMAIAVVSLALTGALAVACFVKAYGVTFLGAARSDRAEKAGPVPAAMLAAMLVLALLCVGLGIAAPWVVSALTAVAASICTVAPVELSTGMVLANPFTGEGVSAPLTFLALVLAAALVVAVRKAKATGGAAFDRDPWACGYAPTSEMAPDSVSFASQADMFMHPLYQIRADILGGAGRFSRVLSASSAEAGEAARGKDPSGRDPFIALVSWLGASAGRFEGGNFRIYVLYIIVAFFVLMTLLLLAQMGGGVR